MESHTDNGEQRFLTKDEIFGTDDKVYEDVYIPQWNGYVRVRSLTAKERDHFEASLQKQVGKRTIKNLDNIRARLVSMTAEDNQGNALFPAPGDVVALGSKNAEALNKLFMKACDLSGITDDDVKELEGKGSEDGSTSSTDLPETSAAHATSS